MTEETRTETAAPGTEPSAPPAATHVEARDRLPARFELGERLGSGGMGTVFAAFDRELDRPVAVKLVRRAWLARSGTRERFRREVRAAARLDDPHLVSVFDADVERGWLAMELVAGETLAARLERAPLDAAEVRRVGVQILAALGALHRAGIVHRDVKPSNVFLGEDGVVRLGDFGIAHVEGSELTETGQALGTRGYMAPEQWRGKADARSDVYGAAATLAVAATASRLDELQDDGGIRDALGRAIGGELARTIDRGLALDPARRWPTAQAFARALERRRLPRLTVAAAVTALVAAAFGVALGWRAELIDRGPAVEPRAAPERVTVALAPFVDHRGREASAAYPYLLGRELGGLEEVECIGYYTLRTRLGRHADDARWVEAARDAGARYVVRGRLRAADARSELQIRVTRLDGHTVWSTVQHGRPAELVAALPEVARDLAGALLGHPPRTPPGERTQPGRHELLAQARRALNRHDIHGAEAAAEHALLLDPDDAEAHYLMAVVTGWIGADDARSRYHARRALDGELEASHRAALEGHRLRMEGRLEAAVAHLERAAQEHPDAPDVRYELFEGLFHLGHTERALATHRRLRELAPELALGLPHVADHHLAHGHEAGIERVIRRARALDLQSQELLEVRALFARRAYDEAIRRIQATSDVGAGPHPTTTAARRWLVGAYLVTGQTEFADALAASLARDDPNHHAIAALTRALREGEPSAIAEARAGVRARLREGVRQYTTHLAYLAVELAVREGEAVERAHALFEATRRPDVRTSVADLLAAEATSAPLAEPGPGAEARAVARAIEAERAGALDEAAQAWAAAAAASNDGTFLLHHRVREAALRRETGAERARALCATVTAPSSFRWSQVPLATRCRRLLDGEHRSRHPLLSGASSRP
ncbi:MAG TPA: protein kinase [Sandaracinaceae bacterium LLY-WYZ-13_1]|nr:protein kinase [Sandaracinaceae bacterium LLY-WYZ-13_1]